VGPVHVVSRLVAAVAVAFFAGTATAIAVEVGSSSSPAFAESSPVEVFCPGTPVGNVVSNDVVLNGTLSPSEPAPGQQFDVTGFQAQVPTASSLLQEAASVGNIAWKGTLQEKIDVTGATPASVPTGAMAFAVPIPNPVPPAGITVDEPSPPATFGPFTASSDNIAVLLSQQFSLTFDDAGNELDLKCAWYPNDALPESGITQDTPPGLPISPVIAAAGSQTTTTQTSVVATGAYEMYCPHTPVGSLVFNDVLTTGTISPQALSAGDQFDLAQYQTQIPIPAGIVWGLVGFGNTVLQGFGSTTIESFGASPSQKSTGLESFDLPLPDPVPSSGVNLDISSASGTIGPFVSSGGAITIAGEEDVLMVAGVSQHIVNMSCQAYPNDTITPSGVVTTQPLGIPILPVITTGHATGSSSTTSTTPPTVPGSQTGAYELSCPASPIGNVVLNDTLTTAALSQSDPSVGQTFTITGYQTQISVPQAMLQLFEGVGIDSVKGFMVLDVLSTGALPTGGPSYPVGYPGGPVGVGTVVASTFGVGTVPMNSASDGAVSPSSTYVPTAPIPFAVDLPNPVPSSGAVFDVSSAPAGLGASLVALGGPITIEQVGLALDFQAPADNYWLNCQAYPNDTDPNGITTTWPQNAGSPVVIATGQSVLTPPFTSGSPGPYELYCGGTPIGNLVLNDATTTATLSPADPSPGEQFEVTGYQRQVTIPAQVASQAASFGASAITGTSDSTLEAVGAAPSSLSTGEMSFNDPLPEPIASSGVTQATPSSPTDFGPFTATGGTASILEAPTTTSTLEVAGLSFTMTCISYPNDSVPTGIAGVPPVGSPIWPLVASTAPQSTTPATQAEGASATSDPASNGTHSGSSSTPTAVATSGALAFTGPGSLTRWLVLAGATFILLGCAFLLLLDTPPRTIHRLMSLGRARRRV